MKLPDEKTIERIFIRYIDKNNIDIVSKHNIGYALENFLLDIRYHISEVFIESEDKIT